MQTPAVFRHGRPTQSMYMKAFDDDTIPDTETLLLAYLPDRVYWPTMTADPAKPNQYLPTASEK